ncbi:arginine--tRNA ligase [Candidatus Kaiserbacteria bacterium]|nr:arginine--tRNA ligase [Candidatus Kaiserbacteria bacterium]
MKERIYDAIREALLRQGPEGQPRFAVERPRDMSHGDYSSNVALVNKLDPQEFAAKLKVEGVEKIEVAGKFINFYLSREALLPGEQVIAQPYAGKTVLVEYTSPNLFKPLHIGNLIGNILGESIARLLQKTGADVKRVNYPSDIGLTVAKGVWGLTQTKGDPNDIKALGEAYKVGNAAYEDGSGKEQIDAINTALYEHSNAEWSDLREQGIATSRRHLDELCARLGTKFDTEFFESESGPLGTDIVRAHIGKVFEESEGAVVYKGAHTRVFLNSRGLPTYEAKEVGLFDLKSKAYPDFDVSLTVTGGEQKDFFGVVFDAIGKIFPDKVAGKTLRHVANGFLRLTTGKMSSRLGNVITGESLLEDLQKDAQEKMADRVLADKEKTAQEIAVGAIKYSVLKSGSGRDILFDPEQSLSLEGDSGPYVQYALVRARSLLRAASDKGIAPSQSDAPEHASVLERVLVHYAETVEYAAVELEPHYLTTYLTELAAAFNSWYAQEKVLGGPHQHYGVFLAAAAERTLAEGLTLLGIPTPEEM